VSTEIGFFIVFKRKELLEALQIIKIKFPLLCFFIPQLTLANVQGQSKLLVYSVPNPVALNYAAKGPLRWHLNQYYSEQVIHQPILLFG
jgi:hypothetical protein